MHAEGLCNALQAAGHETEIVAIPFKPRPVERIPDQILACRLLDLTESNGAKIDALIGLKFPAYLVPHPNKVLWILHQHREAYELWDRSYGDIVISPNGRSVRDAIRLADKQLIAESKQVFANSRNVAQRLQHYCDIQASPLYHPPANAERFYTKKAKDYLLYPSRLTQIKRQELVLHALAQTEHPVKVRFAGAPDHPPYLEHLQDLAETLKIESRVEWLGHVTEEEKRDLYARCLGVLFVPLDEDYGYVTLEAMLSNKAIITCKDSGGPLEFVQDHRTGLVCDSQVSSLANAMDEFWENRSTVKKWGQAGRESYDSLDITWDHVVERLLA